MSESIDDGGFAFPGTFAPGMTLRDYFAGQALGGLLSDPHGVGEFLDYAENAYKFADAMLKARMETAS